MTRATSDEKMSSNKPQSRAIIFESSCFVGVKDIHPVTEGHTLLISKSHKTDFFDLSDEERDDLNRSILSLKKKLEIEYDSISGFNIGANCGKSAGQTVFHFHMHIIPRRDGDCSAPEGGVRGVIASKQAY